MEKTFVISVGGYTKSAIAVSMKSHLNFLIVNK